MYDWRVGWLFLRLRDQRKNVKMQTAATAMALPTATPAIAPELRPLETEGEVSAGAELGLAVVVADKEV